MRVGFIDPFKGRSESLHSVLNDWVPLLGRMMGPYRRLLWKRSSFLGPKCVWKPLLARMLFYSVSNPSLSYISWPIDTISIPYRSWSCSPTTHLVLLDLSLVTSACVFHYSVQACCSLVCHTVSFATTSVYWLSMWLKIYMDYFC